MYKIKCNYMKRQNNTRPTVTYSVLFTGDLHVELVSIASWCSAMLLRFRCIAPLL